MCPREKSTLLKSEGKESPSPPKSKPSGNGSETYDGHTGEPSHSVGDGAQVVRAHLGQAFISAGLLRAFPGRVSASFVVSRLDDSDEYIAMLSCILLPDQWSSLLAQLSTAGDTPSVDVRFAPTTPNLERPTTAPST